MLGLNINALKHQHELAINRTRPAANFLLSPKGEESNKVKAAWPDALLVGRPHVDDGEVHNWYLSGDPTEAGQRAAAICLQQRGGNPAVGAWVIINEPPVKTPEQIARLALFDIAFARALKAVGARACIGAFARGTPEIPSEDGGAALRAYMPALRVAEEVGALVAIHQYGLHSVMQDAEWHALRWQKHILRFLEAHDLSRFEYLITETGVDLGTGRMENGQVKDGWKTIFGDTPEGRDAYANQLRALVAEYARDPRCLGAMLYCAGNQDRWDDFDVTGAMLDRLMAVPWPERAQAPTPVVTPTPVPTPQPTPEAIMDNKLVAILQQKLSGRFRDVRADMPKGSGSYVYADSRKMPIIALHYSAGLAGPVSAKNIAEFHTRPKPTGNGWPGIGYHFVIDEGVVYYVGHVDTQRAHVLGRNDEALGICFTGEYNETLPEKADIEVARLLIAGLDEFYGHKKELRGHWQMLPAGYTKCPGKIVELIPLLRMPTPIPPKPLPVPQWGKIVWAIEQSARTLQQEGLQVEHDHLISEVLPPYIKLRDAK